jgi:hypothetical protein
MKKLLALATALVLIAGLLPITVSAAGNINSEAELRDAFSWGGSGMATLNANIGTLTTQLRIERTSTLDLNGHTLTIDVGDMEGIFISLGRTFTIMCSLGTGVLNATSSTAGIYAFGDLNINGGTVYATGYDGIFLDGSKVTINGGEVNATSDRDWGSGIHVNLGSELNISDGMVNATSDWGAGIRVNWQGAMSISGGVVNATGGWLWGILVNTNSELNISGGTVNAISRWGGGGILVESQGAMSISGGSVNAVGNTRIDGGGTVTNGAGVPVFLNILTTDPLHVNSAVTSASFGGTSYGVNDVRTNASGQLFFYLPATSGDADARVSIGGSNFGARYTRNANHDNTATLIPVSSGITRADVQALVDQNPNPPSGAGILPAHVNRFNAARAMAQRVANPSSPNLQHTNEELITAAFANAIMVFENSITRMHSAIARAEQQ